MPPEISQIEEERMGRFNQARARREMEEDAQPEKSPGSVLSFGDKIIKYWPILAAAVFFDLLALIPFVSVIVNFLFGAILYFYFGSKSKNKKALKSLFYILIPIILGSAIDWIFSLVPVNIFAAFSRIALKEVELTQ